MVFGAKYIMSMIKKTNKQTNIWREGKCVKERRNRVWPNVDN